MASLSSPNSESDFLLIIVEVSDMEESGDQQADQRCKTEGSVSSSVRCDCGCEAVLVNFAEGPEGRV